MLSAELSRRSVLIVMPLLSGECTPVPIGCLPDIQTHRTKRMTPGTNMDDWWTLLRSGMWRLYFQLSAESQVRLFREMLPLLHDTKAEVMGERDNDSYYLVYIGTKATSRGRGYAKKLMLDMIGKVESPPCILQLMHFASSG